MPEMCDVCEKLFSTQSNVNKHYKKVHNLKPKIISYDRTRWSYKCVESDCNSSFQHNNGLINHLSDEHKINMDIEKMKFVSKEAFFAWKHLMEKENKSDYIIVRSNKMKGKLVRYYTCNRSGKKSSVSSNVRLPKSQGSCKLNQYCTSGIKVIESKDILVTWCKTHYGHSIDLQHIKIPKIDRSVVASKLTLGVPTSRILDSYRDQIGNNISREDLITRKDIHNIKISYHMKEIMIGHKAAISSKFNVEVDCDIKNKWYIQTIASKSSELHCVEKLFEQSCCNLICRDCKICSHTYVCTCNDFCVANSICKHIHYIEMTYYSKSPTEEISGSSNLEEMNLSTEVLPKFVNKSDILRQNFSAKILNTTTKLQNADKNKLTDEIILQIESHLTTIDNLLELPSATPDDNFTPQISRQEPGNKKIEKQHRFFSTQKKKRDVKTSAKRHPMLNFEKLTKI